MRDRLLRNTIAIALPLGSALVLLACSQVLGLTEPEPYDAEGVVGDADPRDDGSARIDGATADGAPGCTADLLHDEKNCGACGHGCRGAACQAGRCTPVLVTTARQISALTVDGTSIYFGDGDGFGTNAIVRVEKDGTNRRIIANLAADPGFDSMAVVGPILYWAGTPGIRSCAATGCTGAPLIVTNASRAHDVTQLLAPGSARNVVWLNDARTRVEFQQLDGGVGQLTTLSPATVTDSFCVQLRSAPTFTSAYVTDPAGDRLLVLPRIGVVKPVIAGALTCTLAVTADRIVYADLTHIWAAPIEPTGLGKPVVVANLRDGQPRDLTADDRYVYWHTFTLGAPSMLRASLTGNATTPEVFVEGFDYVTRTAVDAEWLYFVTSGNSGVGARIWKVAK